MAYVSKEMKAKIAPVIKQLLKEYGLRGTLAVNNHSTLVLNISQGGIDFIGNADSVSRETAARRGEEFHPGRGYQQVNVYWISDHYTGRAQEFLTRAYAALKGPDFYDNSDAMTDYFDRSHYQDINIGRWNKPYTYTGK